MIRTVLALTARPGDAERVAARYRELGILRYSLDHSRALSTELSVADDGSGRVMIIALWPDAEAYREWLDNPWRARSGERLRELLGDSVGEGAVYQVRESLQR